MTVGRLGQRGSKAVESLMMRTVVWLRTSDET